jgi:hypothetical protein
MDGSRARLDGGLLPAQKLSRLLVEEGGVLLPKRVQPLLVLLYPALGVFGLPL